MYPSRDLISSALSIYQEFIGRPNQSHAQPRAKMKPEKNLKEEQKLLSKMQRIFERVRVEINPKNRSKIDRIWFPEGA